MRKFIIPIYGCRAASLVDMFSTLISVIQLSVGWISIKLFEIVANVANPPRCSGVAAVQSRPKSHTTRGAPLPHAS